MPDGTLRNPDGDVWQYPDGDMDLEAIVPYPPEALKRKTKTERYLVKLGLHTPAHLPPVIAESEVILRTPDEVAKRAFAIMLTGIQAESFRKNDPINPMEFKERCPIGFAALSNNELDFIYSERATEQDVIDMSWKYEALLPLQ